MTLCESNALFTLECYFPLGMENMKIDNAQVTSSSVFGLHKPYYGRLNLLSFHGDPSRSAWCASAKDKDPYLQLAFGQDITLSGVAIQGLSLFDNFVTSFRLCFSNDGDNFECVKEDGNEKVCRHVFFAYKPLNRSNSLLVANRSVSDV